jgi:hypothetical protein
VRCEGQEPVNYHEILPVLEAVVFFDVANMYPRIDLSQMI